LAEIRDAQLRAVNKNLKRPNDARHRSAQRPCVHGKQGGNIDALADIMEIGWPHENSSDSFASRAFVAESCGKVVAGGKAVAPQPAQH
jgi:hypothetical protein